ncbi:MAG: sugar phosphate nucleotidyltransferase [bacterium]
MKVVIPVAGVGTRLRPQTHTIPKALLTVAGKPILGHILDDVIPFGPSEVVLVVGYMGERVVEYMKRDYPALPVRYVHQEDRKGLGHAIWLTREALDPGQPVLVILGDTIFQADLARVVRDGGSSLGVMEVADPRRFGIVILKDGVASRLVEKPDVPESNLALTGVYYFKDAGLLSQCLELLMQRGITTKGEYQLTDALQLMIERGEKMSTFTLTGWFDCGKPETLLETNRFLLEGRPAHAPIEGATIIAPVAIDSRAVVERSVIGPHVTIAAGAIVRDSVVKNSIVGRNATVERSLLDASLVGENAVVRGAFHGLNVGDDSVVALA